MIDALYRLSSIPLLLFLCCAYVFAFLLLTGGASPESSLLPLDLRFGYSFDEVFALMNTLQADGREAYRTSAMVYDVLYPLVYSFTFATLLALLIGQDCTNVWWSRSVITPFVIAFLDLCENTCIVFIIDRYPQIPKGLVQAASAFTQLKWTVVGVVFVLVLVAAIQRLLSIFGKAQQ